MRKIKGGLIYSVSKINIILSIDENKRKTAELTTAERIMCYGPEGFKANYFILTN